MDMKTSPLSLLKDPSLLKTDALVNGEWLKGPSRFDVHDPSNGSKLADVANLGPRDAEAAIAAASRRGAPSTPGPPPPRTDRCGRRCPRSRGAP